VLYGTTQNGGSNYDGTLFKINTDGTSYSILHNFTNSPDGSYPYAGLTVSGNTLYGTTVSGGSNDWGSVFQINSDGTGFTVLHSFTLSAAGGFQPYGGLAISGNVLYGTTENGGEGVVFAIGLPTPPALKFATTNGNFGFVNQQFRFTLTGQAGSNAVISASTNLLNWIPLATNPLGSGSLSFTDTLATNYTRRIYRATLAP